MAQLLSRTAVFATLLLLGCSRHDESQLCRQRLVEIRSCLGSYADSHDGAYPSLLQSSLPDKSLLECPFYKKASYAKGYSASPDRKHFELWCSECRRKGEHWAKVTDIAITECKPDP